MNLELSESATLLQDTLDRFFAEQGTADRYRACDASGLDQVIWADFVELGFHQLRTPEDRGGVGGSLIDAVLLAEAFGASFAAIPALEAMLANRLLALLDTEASRLAAAGLAEAGGFAVLALHDGRVLPEQIVPGAATAWCVVVRHGESLRMIRLNRAEADPTTGLDGARIVTFAAAAGVELARGSDACGRFEAILSEWKLLQAAAMVAGAQKALRSAAAYARDRIVFDRPIGSFQGLAHPLADALVDTDGAALLVRRAVEAIAGDRSDAGAFVEMAWWWSGRAAANAAIKAMRAFGGYGVTLEHDAQIHVRRITATSLLLGDPAQALERAADCLWSDGAPPPSLPEAGDVALSFEFDEKAAAIAERARTIFARHVAEHGPVGRHDIPLNKALAADGLLYPDLPTAFGGGGYDGMAAAAIKYVFSEFDATHVTVSTTSMLAKMIVHFGTDAARAELLPRLAGGDAYGALCYSEPSGGSDIFAARSSAVPDGDDWVINGQKVFTSGGHTGSFGLFLARTSESKHGGLTMFVVPLDQPGYSYTPVQTMSDDRTNITFYEDVRVPDRYRLGEVDGGVKVLAAALTLEQSDGPLYVARLDRILRLAVTFAQRSQGAKPRLIDSPDVRRRLAAVATHREVADVLSRRTIWAGAHGSQRKYHGPAAKLAGSEAWVSCSTDLMRLMAPFSIDQRDPIVAPLEEAFRASFASTIYAGTSEVQRSIIAEDGLGLPRSRS